MVRTVYSEETCVQYLQHNATQEEFVIGLILGQTTLDRDTIIHLARTPEEKTGDAPSAEYTPHSEKSSNGPSSVLAVSELWVADHAKHVTRMLPGGMFVQGLFIICSEDIFKDQNLFNKVKNILIHMHKCLDANAHMYGNSPLWSEKLVLHWSTITESLTCKSVPIGSSATSQVVDVDWKILPKSNYWQRLDCFYEFDEIYPIVVKNNGVSVKQQFTQILERAVKQIESSVMFIDGELRLNADTLETLCKTKKKSTKSSVSHPPKSMNISLFVPYENSLPDTVEYLECEGSIHFSGVVASCVFLNPRVTVAEAIVAVKQDIVRSLASRFTMHCDSLIDDNLLPEEKVCFNEPPRRVLVPLQSRPAPSGLYLCDYLFPGEAPAEALVSVRELLDVQLHEEDVITDLETPADTSEFDSLDKDTSSEEMIASPREASQFMYIAGISFAVLVLIVSIVIHYYQSIVKFFS